MLYEMKFDNTKNIKLNEGTFNSSIKIAILNKTFEAGLIKEEKYQELKQNILQEYNIIIFLLTIYSLKASLIISNLLLISSFFKLFKNFIF